jgi:hypothetical protein
MLTDRERLKCARHGIEQLRVAVRMFRLAGAPRTTARVRLALSSAKGAVRSIELAPYRRDRQDAEQERTQRAAERIALREPNDV